MTAEIILLLDYSLILKHLMSVLFHYFANIY